MFQPHTRGKVLSDLKDLVDGVFDGHFFIPDLDNLIRDISAASFILALIVSIIMPQAATCKQLGWV